TRSRATSWQKELIHGSGCGAIQSVPILSAKVYPQIQSSGVRTQHAPKPAAVVTVVSTSRRVYGGSAGRGDRCNRAMRRVWPGVAGDVVGGSRVAATPHAPRWRTCRREQVIALSLPEEKDSNILLSQCTHTWACSSAVPAGCRHRGGSP